MKLIAEITDKEILGKEGLSFAEPRYTARAIVKNGDLYSVIHSEKFHPYSLPGGGVDDGEKITAITKYRYSKGDKTTTTKFLVNYSTKRDSSSISYAITTVVYNNTDGKVTSASISTADKDIFRIKLPEPKNGNSTEKKTYTYQDIYYKKGYGLFIGVWHRGNYDTDSDKSINKVMKNHHNLNTIYRVNIDGHSETERAKKYLYTEKDMKNLELDMSGYSDYYKYEIESLAFIKWEDDTYRIIFSANVADKYNEGAVDLVVRVKKTIKLYNEQ